jgi:hypothetical protein
MAFYLTRKPNFCLTKSAWLNSALSVEHSDFCTERRPVGESALKFRRLPRISEVADAWQLPKVLERFRSRFYLWKDFFVKAFAEWLQPVIELH